MDSKQAQTHARSPVIDVLRLAPLTRPFSVTDVVMVVFVTVTLARCCSGPVQRRSLLGVGGIIFVIAAGLAAYGINSAFRK